MFTYLGYKRRDAGIMASEPRSLASRRVGDECVAEHCTDCSKPAHVLLT